MKKNIRLLALTIITAIHIPQLKAANESTLIPPPTGSSIPPARGLTISSNLINDTERNYRNCEAYSELFENIVKSSFINECFRSSILFNSANCIRGCDQHPTSNSIEARGCERKKPTREQAISLLKKNGLIQESLELTDLNYESDMLNFRNGCFAASQQEQQIESIKNEFYRKGFQANKSFNPTPTPTPKQIIDLPTNCPNIRVLSETNKEINLEVVNNCGECATIHMNWTFNGVYQGFAGTWKNVSPGAANRYVVYKSKGIGNYEAVAVRVQSCQ